MLGISWLVPGQRPKAICSGNSTTLSAIGVAHSRGLATLRETHEQRESCGSPIAVVWDLPARTTIGSPSRCPGTALSAASEVLAEISAIPLEPAALAPSGQAVVPRP